MSPKKAAKAPAPAAAVDTKIPFDPEKQEILLDLKGLCGLPFDQELSAVQSFRAMIFPKGKYVHEPRKPGRYLVLGQWRSITALTVVHFSPQLNRSPELLLDFHDYGMASANSMHGTMITTVQLPLLISANVYQKNPRVTTVDDVVAFEPIDASKLPYSKDLAPFLKTQELYRSLNITGLTDLLGYISKALGPRVESIAKRAQLAMASHIDALAQQQQDDPEFTTNKKDALTVLLNHIFDSFRSLPPEAYDATLQTRIKTIEMIDPPDHEEVEMPVWLTSPLKTALAEGTACGPFTRLHRELRSRHSSPVATGGPGPSEGEPDKLVSSPSASSPSSSHNEEDDEDDEDDNEDDDDDDDSEANDSLVKDAPRKRTQVDHYVPGKASKKAKVVAAAPAKVPKPKPAKAKSGQKRVTTDKSCAPGVDPKAPFGRNKHGKPYKRACGAYKQSLHPPGARTSTPATDSGYSKLVTDLRAANEVLTNKLAIAESEVARLKAVEGSAERLARLEGERDKHKEFHDAFMQGLDKGLSMASGQLVVTSGAPASGRAGRSL